MARLKKKQANAFDIRRGEFFPLLALCALSVSPALFLGEGNRNLALIALMFLSLPIAISSIADISGRYARIEVSLLICFAFSMVIVPLWRHPEIRWSTIFYSLMFCGLFLAYEHKLRVANFRIEVFIALLRYLIIAYAGVLLIQQFCVLTGLPVFNASNYDPSRPWKLNALSPEPSHTARIDGLLMLSYIVARRIATKMHVQISKSAKGEAMVWASFLWTMITMNSATSIVFLLVVFFVQAGRLSFRAVFSGLLLLALAALFLPIEETERVLRISEALLTLDHEEILRADHSGGLRIAPLIVLFQSLEIFTVPGMFGHGVDSVSGILQGQIFGVEKGFVGGGLFALWWEYGFFAFLMFTLFSLLATGAVRSPVYFILWILLVFLSGVNTQIMWFAICVLYTLQVFDRRVDRLRARTQGKGLSLGGELK